MIVKDLFNFEITEHLFANPNLKRFAISKVAGSDHYDPLTSILRYYLYLFSWVGKPSQNRTVPLTVQNEITSITMDVRVGLEVRLYRGLFETCRLGSVVDVIYM